MPSTNVKEILRSLALQYPTTLVAAQLRDIPRITFHIESVQRRLGSGASIADVGGGIGLFSLGCAAIGMKATLVDDFRDPVNNEFGDAALDLHRRVGVTIHSCDVVKDGIQFSPESLDGITCFDSMEHWHASPKSLFQTLVAALRPGGLFFLSGPNCVNLRKRISVPFGKGKWSPMSEWYESKTFRAHVREPDVEDLKYIAKDLGLERPTVVGRNWLGYSNRRRSVRLATPIVDRVLQTKPSLCSNIYLLANKIGAPSR